MATASILPPIDKLNGADDYSDWKLYNEHSVMLGAWRFMEVCDMVNKQSQTRVTWLKQKQAHSCHGQI